MMCAQQLMHSMSQLCVAFLITHDISLYFSLHTQQITLSIWHSMCTFIICTVCLRIRGLRSQICDLFISYWLLLDAKVALPATAGYGWPVFVTVVNHVQQLFRPISDTIKGLGAAQLPHACCSTQQAWVSPHSQPSPTFFFAQPSLAVSLDTFYALNLLFIAFHK